ncbi:4-hydroxy-tetrahydrodipicolinate reductase [Roseimaritima multifibrata]|uniref:4-hydroxy-tetrahydrodipicolinate reductase n=1 Tax=Roseimaritima multifibrata TaxID=1930274 RepID=A0A517ML69_9BACT|nr:4-hydroxy-tetrahydrodipicolinate reductase [Roseimaritima multifibrata]QDS95517.1 4-hydroxy-tetrahydrodipicolinate reductase [Roseimaritima multifibrata]
MLRIAVHGAAGRMGRRVVALAAGDPDFRVVAAIEHADHSDLGKDAGFLAGLSELDVPVASAWPDDIDVIVDFSLPEAVDGVIDSAVKANAALVMATTGLTSEQHDRLKQASEKIAIVWAPSMSLAVNLTMRMAQQVTAALKDVSGGVDVEIIERHHRFKEDAPSGTALKFGELIAAEFEREPGASAIKHVHGREGKTGMRTGNEIGYHAVRTGDNPGEHTIVFGMMGETIELKVAASNRDSYAAGALAAAKWLQDQPAGMYSMFDVLGMK